MDPDLIYVHTVYEVSNSLVDDKKHTFYDYALLGLINVSSVCIRLGFS